MDVRAKLWYYVATGRKVITKNILKDHTKAQRGGVLIEKDVLIRDGRRVNHSLDTHSFQLDVSPTRLAKADFYGDEAKIATKYYAEIAECAERISGAERVVCLGHQVRNAGMVKTRGDFVEGYARGVHTDADPESAVVYFDAALSRLRKAKGGGGGEGGSEDLDFSRGRFVFLNVWRNFADEPIEDRHLAVLDHKSVTQGIGSEDYIEGVYYGPESKLDGEFVVKSFRLNSKNSDRHSWFYFPRMTKDEVLLFKHWDSDPQRLARMCFHASFEDPNAAVDAAARESIEVRAVAFFPRHEPDTCPSLWRRWVARSKVKGRGVRERLGERFKVDVDVYEQLEEDGLHRVEV